VTNSTAPAADPLQPVNRFSASVRLVHWSTTVLLAVCIVTAAILYNAPLEIGIGHRRLVELVHVYCGFALPVPMLLGLLSRAYRHDLTDLDRFHPSDWQWLRSRTRRDGSIKVGKFNAGQKLNAALTGGSIIVLLGTGLLMFFTGLVRLSWRSGATFVHDWFALGLGLLVLGHINFARKDAEARRGMRTGQVSAAWARREHTAWAEEIGVGDSAPPDSVPSEQQ
jgi:formate dehydrogenase subunit gamma